MTSLMSANGRPKRKRVALTLAQKFEVVDFYEKNPHIKQKELSAVFSLSQSTVSDMLKRKIQIRQEYESGGTPWSRKRRCQIKFNDVDSALLNWYNVNNNNGDGIDGETLRLKATELAERFQHDSPQISMSWISRWKKNNKITRRRDGAQDETSTEDDEDEDDDDEKSTSLPRRSEVRIQQRQQETQQPNRSIRVQPEEDATPPPPSTYEVLNAFKTIWLRLEYYDEVSDTAMQKLADVEEEFEYNAIRCKRPATSLLGRFNGI